MPAIARSAALCLAPLLAPLPLIAQNVPPAQSFPPEAPQMQSGGCLAGWTLMQALLGATPPDGEPLAAPILEDGHCRLDNPVIASPSMTFHAVRIAWAAQGLDALLQGTLPDRIDLVVDGLVMQPRLDEPLWNFVMLAQARASGGIDLRATLRQAAGVLTVSDSEIRFPDASHLRLQAELTQVNPLMPLETLLRSARLEVRTQGLFERYLLAPLVQAYFDPALPPEMQAEMRRAEASELVAALPDDRFPAPTRQAMAAFISEFPNPRGDLTLQFDAPQGLPLAQFGRLAGVEGASALASALPDVQVEVTYAPLAEGTAVE